MRSATQTAPASKVCQIKVIPKIKGLRGRAAKQSRKRICDDGEVCSRCGKTGVMLIHCDVGHICVHRKIRKLLLKELTEIASVTITDDC